MTPKVAAPQSEAALERELEVRLAAQLGYKVDSFGRWWLLPYNMWLPDEIRDALLSAERQRREALSMLSKLRGKFADGDSCPVCFNDLPEHEKGCVLAEAEALLEGSTQ